MIVTLRAFRPRCPGSWRRVLGARRVALNVRVGLTIAVVGVVVDVPIVPIVVDVPTRMNAATSARSAVYSIVSGYAAVPCSITAVARPTAINCTVGAVGVL